MCQLVEVRGAARMKISEDPEKSTVPGRKEVYRIVDAEGENSSSLLTLISHDLVLVWPSFSCTTLT